MNIVFAGTPGFAARHLQCLADSHHTISAVITQPDKPGKRGKKPLASPVKSLAAQLGIPVRQPERMRSSDIADLSPDIMVVVAYGQILKDKVLKLPRLGCINVHASLLPRWRGAAPIQRAILAGDQETGVCVMQMDKGLDTGDVIHRVNVPITPADNAGSLSEKLAEAGGPALLASLDQLESGIAQWTPQPQAGMTYANKIEKAECELDWASARETDRAVHAFNPDPVSFTNLGEMRVKIWDAMVVEATGTNVTPGEILDVTKKGILVACITGKVLITALQLPLGKGSILSGADVLNSRSDLIHKGRCFGA